MSHVTGRKLANRDRKCKLCRGVLAQFAHKVPQVRSWIRGSQRVCTSQGSASAAAASQAAQHMAIGSQQALGIRRQCGSISDVIRSPKRTWHTWHSWCGAVDRSGSGRIVHRDKMYSIGRQQLRGDYTLRLRLRLQLRLQLRLRLSSDTSTDRTYSLTALTH